MIKSRQLDVRRFCILHLVILPIFTTHQLPPTRMLSNMDRRTFTTISTVLGDGDQEELEHARPSLSSERLSW
uniref:Uncharacterized protein n=1 Tax=Hyaloperonospora arabidopsidis (strain Emoy2) TaxID=559515 RepID=M4BE72_HYAAE